MFDTNHPIGGAEVMVVDQEKALKFYIQKLGFEKSTVNVDEVPKYFEVSLPNSAFRISLVDPNSIQDPKKREISKKKIGASVGLCFYTDDIQEFYSVLKSRGVEITKPISQDWGEKQTMFFDQDKNEFVVFERR